MSGCLTFFLQELGPLKINIKSLPTLPGWNRGIKAFRVSTFADLQVLGDDQRDPLREMVPRPSECWPTMGWWVWYVWFCRSSAESLGICKWHFIWGDNLLGLSAACVQCLFSEAFIICLFLFYVHCSGYQVFWNWGYRQVSATMWVLGFESGSSGKTISAPNCWAISREPATWRGL